LIPNKWVKWNKWNKGSNGSIRPLDDPPLETTGFGEFGEFGGFGEFSEFGGFSDSFRRAASDGSPSGTSSRLRKQRGADAICPYADLSQHKDMDLSPAGLLITVLT
jgi:hypothetical protein